ncbi:C39 family peptidase [Plantactinospora sp. B5E13]|uniref:C39 family peptidase n=1 Tax=unclassified Plantactinospora TaxID=2631981 RepID=UPI00325D39B8
MKHAINQRLRTAVSGRRNRFALATAAVLAAAATSGVVLASQDAPAPTGAATVAVAELGSVPAGGQAGAAVQPITPATTDQATPAGGDTASPSTSATGGASPTGEAKKAVKAEPPAAPAAKTLDYNFQAQTTYYYCGPAATRIALTARDLSPSQDTVASRLGTTTSGTNSAEDTTRVLNSVIGTDFYRTTAISGQSATPAQMDQLQADVVHAVSNGYAVVANIAGSAVDTAGMGHSYPGGHYLTVVGYRDNGRTVKIADPAIPGSDSTYWMTTINLANWIATRGYSA